MNLLISLLLIIVPVWSYIEFLHGKASFTKYKDLKEFRYVVMLVLYFVLVCIGLLGLIESARGNYIILL